MFQGWMCGYSLEPVINFLLAAISRSCRSPTDKVVLEDAFMELVMGIWRKATEYICVQ
jgi:hypothetical protein